MTFRFVGRGGVPSPPGWRLGLCDLELGHWEAQILGSSSAWPTHGCVMFGRVPPLSEPQLGSWTEHLSGLKPRTVGSRGGWGLLFLEMCVRLGVAGFFPSPLLVLPTHCSLSVPCCCALHTHHSVSLSPRDSWGGGVTASRRERESVCV